MHGLLFTRADCALRYLILVSYSRHIRMATRAKGMHRRSLFGTGHPSIPVYDRTE